MAPELIAPPPRKSKRRRKATSPKKTSDISQKAISAEEIYDWFRPAQLNWKNVDWTVVLWMAGIHLGCLAAPFYFSWKALILAAVVQWMTSSIGVCLGLHRYLTHKSFKLNRPTEFFVMLCSVASGEGSPLMWTATHRLHHQRSDQEGDPHSPLEGRWWSHMMWLFVNHSKEQRQILFRRYAPDLVDRPLLQFFERTYGRWLIGTGVLLYLLAGIPGVVWGMCVRMTIAYHGTWLVNSATHLWGYRNYETRDESRNLWWVALFAYGEGWHNNHHAHPSAARAGHKWWEIDMTWWVIRAMRGLGLATDVNDSIPLREPAEQPAA